MCVNKYEVRMKATFFYAGKIVNTLTLIDYVEAENMNGALEKISTLKQNLLLEFDFELVKPSVYDELNNLQEVDDMKIDVSAIVAVK